MSKQLTAATRRQGCSTPINLPKDPTAVKEIECLIESNMLLALDEGARRTYELVTLFKTLQDTAKASTDLRDDADAHWHALIRITTLASIGAYIATEIADFTGVAHETARDKDVPAILAAVGGAQS